MVSAWARTEPHRTPAPAALIAAAERAAAPRAQIRPSHDVHYSEELITRVVGLQLRVARSDLGSGPCGRSRRRIARGDVGGGRCGARRFGGTGVSFAVAFGKALALHLCQGLGKGSPPPIV